MPVWDLTVSFLFLCLLYVLHLLLSGSQDLTPNRQQVTFLLFIVEVPENWSLGAGVYLFLKIPLNIYLFTATWLIESSPCHLCATAHIQTPGRHTRPCPEWGVVKPIFQRCNSLDHGAWMCKTSLLLRILLLHVKYLCSPSLCPCHVPVKSETCSLMASRDAFLYYHGPPFLPHRCPLWLGGLGGFGGWWWWWCVCVCVVFTGFLSKTFHGSQSTFFATFRQTLSADLWCHWVFWPTLYTLAAGSFLCLLWAVHS